MIDPIEDPSERFLRFHRRKMIALLIVGVAVGAIGLALMLTPTGPAWRSISRASLVPIAIAVVVVVQLMARTRRWAPDSPEVRRASDDEWQRTVMDQASRTALIVVLIAQWPLALMLGFLEFPPPRASMAMAMATITVGLATQLGLSLYLDRE
jgi:hypothetical protein